MHKQVLRSTPSFAGLSSGFGDICWSHSGLGKCLLVKGLLHTSLQLNKSAGQNRVTYAVMSGKEFLIPWIPNQL